jgi:hypothetical protein
LLFIFLFFLIYFWQKTTERGILILRRCLTNTEKCKRILSIVEGRGHQADVIKKPESSSLNGLLNWRFKNHERLESRKPRDRGMRGEEARALLNLRKQKQECDREEHCMFQGSTDGIRCGSKQRLSALYSNSKTARVDSWRFLSFTFEKHSRSMIPPLSMAAQRAQRGALTITPRIAERI